MAKAKKWGEDFDRKQADEKKAEYKNIIRPWSKNELMVSFTAAATKIVIEKGKKAFLMDDYNQSTISDLAGYFSGTETTLHPDAGILMMGGVGNGKTTIMEAFGKNKKGCYRLIEAREMVHYVRNNGAESWKFFLKGSDSPGLKENFYQRSCGWLIDDIGLEEVVTDFGFRLDVIANIVLAIEKDRKKYAGMFHFTTNHNADKLQERYGPRVSSRLGEICNQVVLRGSSRRGIIT